MDNMNNMLGDQHGMKFEEFFNKIKDIFKKGIEERKTSLYRIPPIIEQILSKW